MLRNRIHRLLGAQHEVKLPQCSDLFGRKGLSFLDKLELPAPARHCKAAVCDRRKTKQTEIFATVRLTLQTHAFA
jgi:hypothetical protein